MSAMNFLVSVHSRGTFELCHIFNGLSFLITDPLNFTCMSCLMFPNHKRLKYYYYLDVNRDPDKSTAHSIMSAIDYYLVTRWRRDLICLIKDGEIKVTWLIG